jgi:hypothetical protein
LSANAYANVRRHYTVAQMADRALAVYEELLQGRAAGAPPAAVA